MNSYVKRLVVIEGIDGAGKSTLVKNIKNMLPSRQIYSELFFDHEPLVQYDCPLFHRFPQSLSLQERDELEAAYLHQCLNHLETPKYGIIYRTNNLGVVISDRYIFSMVAYQSLFSNYQKVLERCSHIPWPHLLIYINIDPAVAYYRVRQKGELNKYNVSEYTEIQANYKRVIAKYVEESHEDCKLIMLDGEGSPKYNASDALDVIEEMYGDN